MRLVRRHRAIAIPLGVSVLGDEALIWAVSVQHQTLSGKPPSARVGLSTELGAPSRIMRSGARTRAAKPPSLMALANTPPESSTPKGN
jgi:hypothetical protein